MSRPTLFDPVEFGPLHLRNRIFMAPMTRGRATSAGTPTALMPIYYRQRAGAGLLITEATAISPQGVGWLNAPGVWTNEHVTGWKAVTEAVHAEGGAMFLQLWHMGRVSHPDFLGGALPVGPSAIAAVGESATSEGKKPYVVPRVLEASELPGIAADYAAAARRAIEAGFDGVEIHGANGYLIDQFIRDGANHRTDEYGGSIARRWRFPLEVVDAVVAAVGAERTGIRVSPVGKYNGMSDHDPVATFSHGVRELGARGLVYVHVFEAGPGHPAHNADAPRVHPYLRDAFPGRLILNGGYTFDSGQAALAENWADAIAFGIPLLANPDLPRRFREGAAMNPPDFATLYTSGERGYTDYPALPT